MKQKVKKIGKKVGKFLWEQRVMLACLGLMVIRHKFALADDLPWEGPLDKIQTSLTGPVAKALAILSVVACGCLMAFGEMGSAMKRLVNIVFGLSLVFAAVTWVPSFFGTN